MVASSYIVVTHPDMLDTDTDSQEEDEEPIAKFWGGGLASVLDNYLLSGLVPQYFSIIFPGCLSVAGGLQREGRNNIDDLFQS